MARGRGGAAAVRLMQSNTGDWIEAHWKILSGGVMLAIGALWRAVRFVFRGHRRLVSAIEGERHLRTVALPEINVQLDSIHLELVRLSSQIDSMQREKRDAAEISEAKLNRIHERIDQLFADLMRKPTAAHGE